MPRRSSTGESLSDPRWRSRYEEAGRSRRVLSIASITVRCLGLTASTALKGIDRRRPRNTLRGERPGRISRASSRTTGLGRTVAIGGEVRLRITGPYPRCVMITLTQGDLPKDAGILRTAAQHNQANVGVYADVIASGTTRRGDRVTVA